MKLPYKILAIQFATPLFLGLIYFLIDKFSTQSFFSTYGFVAIAMALFDFVAGIALAISGITKNKACVIGLLLSGALLLVTGFFAITQIEFGR